MSGNTTPPGWTARAWRPSNARYVQLDGYLPLPRGAAPPSTAPLSWPPRDPSDVLDYEIDAGQALLGNDGDTLTGVSVSVLPPEELLPGQTFVDGQTAIVWFSGGVAGTTYVVQATLSTAAGRTINRAILMPVQSLGTAPAQAATTGASAQSALTTSAGVVVTDQNGAPVVVSG